MKTIDTDTLHRLIGLYFDGSLDRKEEQALRRVLAYTKLHSPSIDEARAVMGLEVAMHRSAPPVRHTRRTALWSVVFAICAVAIMRSAPQEAIEVYAGGRPVLDRDRAARIALAQQREAMQILEQMTLIAEKEQAEIENLTSTLQ